MKSRCDWEHGVGWGGDGGSGPRGEVGGGVEERQERVVGRGGATVRPRPDVLGWGVGGAHLKFKVINLTGANPNPLPKQKRI